MLALPCFFSYQPKHRLLLYRNPHYTFFISFCSFFFFSFSFSTFTSSLPFSLPSKISATNQPNNNHETQKTRTRLLMADIVLAIVELQDQIRVYLSHKDVKTCTLVSRQWNRYGIDPSDTMGACLHRIILSFFFTHFI